MKKGPTSKRYSEAFKCQIVRDLERGKTTPAEAAKKYGITGGATIESWLRKYGTSRTRGKPAKNQKTLQSRKMLVLERQKRELEQAVARLTVEKVALESLIEEAQAHLGMELKKTFGTGR